MADHIEEFNENDFLAEFGDVPDMPVSSMFEGAKNLAGDDGSAYDSLGSEASSFGRDEGRPEAFSDGLADEAVPMAGGMYANLNKLEDFSPETIESFPPMMTTGQMMANQIQDQTLETEETELPPDLDRERRLIESMRIAASYNTTDEAGRILWESARHDLTPDELARAPEFFRLPSLSPKDVARLSHRYPSVSMLMQEPWIMATFGSGKEATALGFIEKAFERPAESWQYAWTRGEMTVIGGRGLAGVDRGNWRERREALRQRLEALPQSQTIKLTDEQRRLFESAEDLNASFFKRSWGRPAMASLLGEDYFLPTSGEMGAAGDLVNAGIKGGFPEVGARAAEVAAEMVHSAVQPETWGMAATGAAVGSAIPAAGTLYGAGAGGTVGMAMVNYYKGLDRGYFDAIERGVPEQWAMAAGVLTGLMNAFTETAQFGIAATPVKGVTGKTGGKLFKTYALELVERTAKETGLEMGQETLEMLSQDFATLMSNQFSGTDLDFNSFQDYVEQNWETFKFMALGGSWVAGAGPAVSLPRDMIALRRVRRAESVQAMADNLAAESLVKEVSAVARDSEAMRAAPEAAGAIIERIAQDKGGPQAIFIEAEVLETYRQSAFENDGLDWADFEDAFLEPMGLTAEQYRSALDEGVSLELPLSGIPAVAGNPVWQAIEQSEGVIRAEPARVTNERIELADSIEDPFAEVTLVPNVTEETKAGLERRLVEEAGRPKEQAQAGAEILSRGVSRLLESLGTDPNVWLNEKLSFSQVNSERPGAPLNQAAAHIPADDPRVVFRNGMKELPGLEPVVVPDVGVEMDYDQARETAKQLSQQVVENADLGESIRITNSGIRETMRHRPGRADLKAFEVLPEMLARAQWVRKDPNARESGRVSEVLFLYAPVEVDGQLYAAQITAKRGESGELHYYGHSLKKVEGNPATWSGEAASADATSGSAMSPLLSFKLIDILENVKRRGSRLPGDLRTLFQDNDGSAPRGWLDVLTGQGLRINFTEAADATTAIHEAGHLFVELARQVLASAPDQIADWEAFTQLNDDFQAFAKWAGQDDPYTSWSTEAHEKAARGLEAFLMEGRAPVPGLRRIFEKIKAWMIDVYRSLRNLDAPLTPEVRDFFNRLLASDMELALDGWRTAEPEGLAPEVQAELAEPRQEARRAMEEAIRQKRVGEVEKMRRQWRKEGAEEADLDPHQRMLADIIGSGGLSLDSLKTIYGQRDIAALSRKRPGLVSAKSKVGFDEFAERYGYGSDSDAFIQSLKDAPTRDRLINRYVSAQEEFYADYLAEDAPITEAEINLAILEAEAIRLKDNAKEAVRVLRETKKALKQEGGVSRLKRAIHESTGLKIVDELARKNMADLKASLKAEARAARVGEKAGLEKGKAIGYKRGAIEGYRVGSRDGAAAKRIELALKYKAEKEAKADIQKTMAKWKRFVKQKPASPTAIREGGIDPEFSVQAKQLLNQFGFNVRDRGRLEIKDAPSLAMFVADQEVQGNDIYVPDWILNGRWPVDSKGRAKTLGQLTYDQFTDVKNTIDSLLHVGRENQKLLAGENRQTFEEAEKVIIEHVEKNVPLRKDGGPGPVAASATAARQIGAQLAKPEYVIRELDGYETMGPVWEILYKTIKKASDAEIVLGEKMVAAISEAWSEFTPKEKHAMGTSPGREKMTKLAEKTWLPVPKSWRTTRHTFEGAPHSLTRAEMVVVAANVGNPDNLANLIEGNGFTIESLAAVCDALTDKEWRAVHAMIAAINQLYEPLAATHYKATGVRLPKVDPGEITLPNGVKRQGWYFPIVRDQDKSHMAYQQGQADTAANTLGSMGYGRRSARSGASHQRTGAIGALSLSLDAVNKHIKDTTHDITHRLPVRDVQRLLNRKNVRQAIVDRVGLERFKVLQQGLNWVAKPNAPALEGFDWYIDTLRRNVVFATLAFNPGTPIMQFSGFFQSADFIGVNAVRDGIVTLAKNPQQIAEFVRGQSPEVRARDQGFDRDLKEQLDFSQDAGILANEREAASKMGFWAIQKCDRIVVYATWIGAYNKAVQEGRSLEWAREYADTAVRMTQPLAAPKDTAAIQRRTDLWKTTVMYYTFFSGFQNRLTERVRGTFVTKKLKPTDLMSTVLMTIILPALFAYVYNNEDIPDEPEEFKDLFLDIGSYSVTGLPLARDLANIAFTDYPYQITPVAQVGESIEWAVKSKDKEKKARNSLKAAGYIFGLPTPQALRTWDGLWALANDETDNPLRLFKPEPREKD